MLTFNYLKDCITVSKAVESYAIFQIQRLFRKFKKLKCRKTKPLSSLTFAIKCCPYMGRDGSVNLRPSGGGHIGGHDDVVRHFI